MIQYRDPNRNLDTDDILSLLSEWDTEGSMDMPSTFHMREYYVPKNKNHDPDNTTYMVALSDETIISQL